MFPQLRPSLKKENIKDIFDKLSSFEYAVKSFWVGAYQFQYLFTHLLQESTQKWLILSILGLLIMKLYVRKKQNKTKNKKTYYSLLCSKENDIPSKWCLLSLYQKDLENWCNCRIQPTLPHSF